VDTQTRHALKKDKFVQAATSGASWLGDHRSGVVRATIAGLIALAVIVAALIFWNVRSSSADSALGAAMDIYNAPLTMPGQPAGQGVYATAADRSKAANSQFVAVANQYGMMRQGKIARYFAGVTYQELGQTSSAETELNAAVGSWDRNLSNLGRVALAGIYRQTGRDSQAIDLYNQIVSHPSTTVTAAVAQLNLADLYQAQGKQDQARALWAHVQDTDKQSAAAQIAAEKLSSK
jgi:predicted negative regulator of RcsB-dependent stress response